MLQEGRFCSFIQLLPPAITEEDAQRGILSLIQRGLIPPAADLTLDPSPIKQAMVPLHDPKERLDSSKGVPSMSGIVVQSCWNFINFQWNNWKQYSLDQHLI